MLNGVGLPPEIMEDILLRLPATSLCRFRCVSWPWLSLISRPEFVRSHLNRNAQFPKLILVSDIQSLYSLDLQSIRKVHFPDASSVLAKKLIIKPRYRWEEIYASCDGLVLAADQDDSTILMNPTTRECVKIPVSAFHFPHRCTETIYGLGYDSSADDYVVVSISFYDDDREQDEDGEPVCADMFVNVYSLRSNCWKGVENSPFDHSVALPSPGVYLKGSIHWLACRVSDYSSVIACFSLDDCSFKELCLPSLNENQRAVYYVLSVLDGFLCLVVPCGESQTDVWMMKEYGNGDSWTKISIHGKNFSSLKPLCYLGNSELLLENDREEVLIYDVDRKTMRQIFVHGTAIRCEVGGVYLESLISPKCHLTDSNDLCE